jgi:ComF family protein
MLKNLLFPCRCIGCFRELPDGALCSPCAATIEKPKIALCPHCGQRLPRGILPSSCREALRIDRLATAAPYSHPIVRAAIDALKYKGIRDLAKPLGILLGEAVEEILDDASPLLLPIPLSPKRLRERGFNQSGLLARTVADALNLPLATHLIRRTRDTKQQAKLSEMMRHENVRDAFAATIPPNLQKHPLILIDDVVTTGATFREAARALRSAGAREVWAAAVAYG